MKHISPEELQQSIPNDQLFLLDVREPAEREEFNIGGTLIPPSPLLSAFNVRITYLMVVCSVNVQITQESDPRINASLITFP